MTIVEELLEAVDVDWLFSRAEGGVMTIHDDYAFAEEVAEDVANGIRFESRAALLTKAGRRANRKSNVDVDVTMRTRESDDEERAVVVHVTQMKKKKDKSVHETHVLAETVPLEKLDVFLKAVLDANSDSLIDMSIYLGEEEDIESTKEE